MSNAFEPIAIIGIGCRFPGNANDVDSYWEMLREGRDAVTPIPENRFSSQTFIDTGRTRIGKTQSAWGGFVSDIDRFDPELFGIAPREAVRMDPQQRMLLEVAYRATEDAGIAVESLAGQAVSVHVGISSIDYAIAGLSFRDRGVIGPYHNTGSSSSIAANRISYCFDLRGESVAVDTACSSSLIAIHQACRALQDKQTPLAFAGGVNALLLPDFFVAFSQLGVLSTQGRCKTFDAGADGYVRGEGAGMILLKRLSDAVNDGDSIYAVIRAAATNQDGRTEGMTVPSESAQCSLIHSALAIAGIRAQDVSYVEAHGTGTPVGDPIEARAIVQSYGRDRSSICRVGSVKTNLGHLEAGAGMASVIKVALALKHAKVPAHLHLETLHPSIDFARHQIQVESETVDWSCRGKRIAGINGFGYGGANAHLILEEHETLRSSRRVPASGSTWSAEQPKGSESPLLLPISAHSESALVETAKAFADWLENTNASAGDIARSAAFRRSHHTYRAAVVGDSVAEWVDGLRSLQQNEEQDPPSIIAARQDADHSLAFVFCGQGAQWWAMGRGMMADQTFRKRLEACEREYHKHVSWSLMEELYHCEAESRLSETAIAQPCLFALQVALADKWMACGIRPRYVLGHSVGEIAAAYVSGALSFEDACCVAIHRGRTMDAASSRGGMLAVGLSAEEAAERIGNGAVAIAAINGPKSLTLSGARDELDGLHDRLNADGVFCKHLNVEYAFHSNQMDPVETPLLQALRGIKPRHNHTTLISTVTGAVIDGESLGADYWWQNVRQCVRFSDAIDCLTELDVEVAVEVGPHPVLAFTIAECSQAKNRPLISLPSLHREGDDLRTMLRSLGRLYQQGFPIDWQAVNDLHDGPDVKLPPLAMTRQSLWSESLDSAFSRAVATTHPMLGSPVEGPGEVWENRIDLKKFPELADHLVRGACVLPAAALVEMAAAAFQRADQRNGAAISLRDLSLLNPCLLTEQSPQRIQTVYDRSRRRVRFYCSDVTSAEWSDLATCEVASTHRESTLPDTTPDKAMSGLPQNVRREALYDHCVQLGLNYGPAFSGVQRICRQAGQAWVSAEVPAPEDKGYLFPPNLLDSCFHAMIAADPDFDHTIRGLYLPNRIASIDVHAVDQDVTPTKTYAHARILSKDDKRMVADIDVFDLTGRHCLAIRGFESVCVSGTSNVEPSDELIYRYVWQPAKSNQSDVAELESDESQLQKKSQRLLVFVDQSGVGHSLIEQLNPAIEVVQVQHGQTFKRLGEHSYIVDPECSDHFVRLASELGDDFTQAVFLWGLDVPENDEMGVESLTKSVALTTLAPMHFVQAFKRGGSGGQGSPLPLSFVTREAQPRDDAVGDVVAAAGTLVGFARVIASELSQFKTKLIDVAGDDPSVARELVGELLDFEDQEDEVMYRDAIRWVRRFVPGGQVPLGPECSSRQRATLTCAASCAIDDLRYESATEIALQPNEIEIRIVATGLNFSDVMKSLGLYPGVDSSNVPLGVECSGYVARVGSAVDRWRVGDEVVSIAHGSFATHVSVNESMVAAKPTNLSHTEAAALPIAFLTAQYALRTCGNLSRGERVLIHSASGGVGLAAMQLARQLGAEVFATAGSEEKRDAVRRRGAHAVMDSRSLDFARQTLEATDGQGVDVVLNSLPGEAIDQGLKSLRVGGRFLEIGKRDIYNDSPLGLLPFRNNLAFFAIDLDQLIREQPQRMGTMLGELMNRFESGELEPLPIVTFDVDDTKDAFRLMQKAKHIGKVVVEQNSPVSDVFAGRFVPPKLSPDRTVWIAGGMGGFGMRVAQWAIDRGARHLVLGGRSKTCREEVLEAIERWQRDGVETTFLPVDLTNQDSVRDAVAKIEQQCPPLGSVIHCAMVLEDRLLADLDRETLMRVLGPKVFGGWNLHHATREIELDHFILFSSLSSVFGHAGQANYSAANAFLDSLAFHRRAEGLPATVINWGHVGEVGYLAARSELSQRLERQGVLTFSADEAMNCLDFAVQSETTQQSVLRMDWSTWRGLGITGEVSPRFAHLIPTQDVSRTNDQSIADVETIRGADGEQQLRLIADAVAFKAAMLLGMERHTLPHDRTLVSLGLDSLMAVEMRNWIESHFKIDLPISEVMRSGGVNAVSAAIAELLTLVPPADDSPSAAALLEQLPDMSDDQVDQLLSQMMNQQQGDQHGG